MCCLVTVRSPFHTAGITGCRAVERTLYGSDRLVCFRALKGLYALEPCRPLVCFALAVLGAAVSNSSELQPFDKPYYKTVTEKAENDRKGA